MLTPEYVEEATGYTTRLELSGPGASTEGKAQNILQQIAAPTKICIAAVAAAVVDPADPGQSLSQSEPGKMRRKSADAA